MHTAGSGRLQRRGEPYREHPLHKTSCNSAHSAHPALLAAGRARSAAEACGAARPHQRARHTRPSAPAPISCSRCRSALAGQGDRNTLVTGCMERTHTASRAWGRGSCRHGRTARSGSNARHITRQWAFAARFTLRRPVRWPCARSAPADEDGGGVADQHAARLVRPHAVHAARLAARQRAKATVRRQPVRPRRSARPVQAELRQVAGAAERGLARGGVEGRRVRRGGKAGAERGCAAAGGGGQEGQAAAAALVWRAREGQNLRAGRHRPRVSVHLPSPLPACPCVACGHAHASGRHAPRRLRRAGCCSASPPPRRCPQATAPALPRAQPPPQSRHCHRRGPQPPARHSARPAGPDHRSRRHPRRRPCCPHASRRAAATRAAAWRRRSWHCPPAPATGPPPVLASRPSLPACWRAAA
jgi:hypothetical protein